MCSCFLDIDLLHIRHHKLLPVWQYLVNCYTVRKKKEIFILDERTAIQAVDRARKLVYHSVIVSCCVDCAKFQIILNTCIWQSLDSVHCSNVVQDEFTFGHVYREEILIREFPNEEMNNMDNESESESEETITFTEEPFKKSCFTDSKLNYECFCRKC